MEEKTKENQNNNDSFTLRDIANQSHHREPLPTKIHLLGREDVLCFERQPGVHNFHLYDHSVIRESFYIVINLGIRKYLKIINNIQKRKESGHDDWGVGYGPDLNR